MFVFFFVVWNDVNIGGTFLKCAPTVLLILVLVHPMAQLHCFFIYNLSHSCYYGGVFGLSCTYRS